MQKSLSVYLHLVRFIAALAVVFSHVNYFFFPVLSSKIAAHGSEAVAIFFVMSGFMMRHVTRHKENDVQRYGTARLARIFSVIPIAILAGIAADMIGSTLDPSRYAQISFYHGPVDLKSIGASIFFVNEVWFNHFVVGSNEAYWSLGFEVQYYLAFAIFCFSRSRVKAVWLILWALCVGPKICLYLPLWSLGVIAYDFIFRLGDRQTGTHIRTGGLILFIGSAISYIIFRFVLHQDARSLFRTENYREMLHIAVHFYIVGLLFTANVVGFALYTNKAQVWPVSFSKSVTWLAGGSFTLYLAHEPLLLAASTILPQARTDRTTALLAMFAVIGVSYLYAELGERRKNDVQSLVRRDGRQRDVRA